MGCDALAANLAACGAVGTSAVHGDEDCIVAPACCFKADGGTFAVHGGEDCNLGPACCFEADGERGVRPW